jgi:hypothetical protein
LPKKSNNNELDEVLKKTHKAYMSLITSVLMNETHYVIRNKYLTWVTLHNQMLKLMKTNHDIDPSDEQYFNEIVKNIKENYDLFFIKNRWRILPKASKHYVRFSIMEEEELGAVPYKKVREEYHRKIREEEEKNEN